MKLQILPMLIGAIVLTIATTADAQVSVNFGVNTCGYPSIYQSCVNYAPPPTIYLGGGRWGDDDRGDRRGHDNRGRDNGARNDAGRANAGGHNGAARAGGDKHR